MALLPLDLRPIQYTISPKHDLEWRNANTNSHNFLFLIMLPFLFLWYILY